MLQKLHESCLKKDWDFLQEAIKQFIPAQIVCEFACDEQLSDVFDFIIQNVEQEYLKNIFEIACCTENLEFVSRLLKLVPEKTNVTGMYNAIHYEREKIVIYLHKNVKTYSPYQAFCIAVRGHNEKIIDFLLSCHLLNDSMCEILFEFACIRQSLKYANFCVFENKYKPTHVDFLLVCEYGNLVFLQFFVDIFFGTLDKGLIVNTLNKGLIKAFENKQWEMVANLCQHTNAQLCFEFLLCPMSFDDISILRFNKVPISVLNKVPMFESFCIYANGVYSNMIKTLTMYLHKILCNIIFQYLCGIDK